MNLVFIDFDMATKAVFFSENGNFLSKMTKNNFRLCFWLILVSFIGFDCFWLNFGAFLTFSGDPEIQDGLHLVIMTSYDVIASCCENQRKYLWTYYESSNPYYHSFYGREIMERRGGGGGELAQPPTPLSRYREG